MERAERVADVALDESRAAFADGVARSMVEYELRDAQLCKVMGVDPKRLQAANAWWTSGEYATREWRALRQTGVSRRNVHTAFYAAATRLRAVEDVMFDLHEAFGGVGMPRRAPGDRLRF